MTRSFQRWETEEHAGHACRPGLDSMTRCSGPAIAPGISRTRTHCPRTIGGVVRYGSLIFPIREWPNKEESREEKGRRFPDFVRRRRFAHLCLRRRFDDRQNSAEDCGFGEPGTVVLGNPDLIDKVEVDLLPSISPRRRGVSRLRFLVGVVPQPRHCASRKSRSRWSCAFSCAQSGLLGQD